MKRVFFLLFCLIFIFLNVNTRAFVAKSIDLNLNDNEVGIVFLRLDGNRSLLIVDSTSSNLFVLDYDNVNGIKEALRIFDVSPNVFYFNDSFVQKIDNTYVIKKDGLFEFRINNYNLCVYDGFGSGGNCDFIYLLNLNECFVPSENVQAIFYDDDIDKKWLLGVLESWVDSYIVDSDNFSILKLNEESYNVVVVPSTKS